MDDFLRPKNAALLVSLDFEINQTKLTDHTRYTDRTNQPPC